MTDVVTGGSTSEVSPGRADHIRSAVVLYVADLSAMRRFYASVTTLVLAHGDDTYASLEAPGAQLLLILSPRRSSPPGAIRENPALKPAFVVDDLAAGRALVADLGGRLDGPELEFGFCEFLLCDGVDPEGNVFQLRQLVG